MCQTQWAASQNLASCLARRYFGSILAQFLCYHVAYTCSADSEGEIAV